MSETTKVEVPLTLLQRLNAVMKDVSYVQKDKAITTYKVVTHDKVTAAVRPSLVKHGVFYYPHVMKREQVGNRTEIEMTVRFVNVDNGTDFIDVPSIGYGIDGGDKGPGKAISYAVKYAILKALGLETGEDADNEITKHEAPPKGELAERGPRGGRAKTETTDKVLVLNVGKDAYSYPVDGSWKPIEDYINDLAGAVDTEASVWDINMNTIRKIESACKKGDKQGPRDDLLSRLAEIELLVGGGETLRAG